MDRKKRLLNRVLLVSGASAVLLLAGYVWYLKRPPHHFYLPEGFSGWVTVRFEKKNAPPLPEENGALKMVIPASGILETSTELEEGWARDAFFEYSGSGASKEVTRTENVDGQTHTRVHDLVLAKMRYDSVIVALPNPVDTVLWDGARISRNGDAVEVREGRPVLLHFYYSGGLQPFFSPHDSLPVARRFW